MTRPTISLAATADDVAAVAELFRAYAASLPVDLGYQDFEAELAGLPGKYAPPAGALLIARNPDRRAVGCVGVRPFQPPRVCEMKRLYVGPDGRGSGLGWRLAEAAVEQARSMGYAEMRLDTLASMTTAISLYDRLGFRRTAAYYDPTPAGTIFMAMDL